MAQKPFVSFIPFLIVGIGLLPLLLITSRGASASKTNLALNRVQLCILSKNAVNRTQEDIEECYTRIEELMDLKLKRDDQDGG